MSGSVRSNFRGLRALLIHPADNNRDVLERTLQRLGLDVEAVEDATQAKSRCDIVFADADKGFTPVSGDIPHIAIIGLEAPSRLVQVARRRLAAYLMKPVRPTGIYTALFIAFNEQDARRREMQERDRLMRRTAGRRAVIKAVLYLMRRDGLDDDAAFQALRREAMRARMQVEEFAAELVAANPTPLGDATQRRKINKN